MKKIIMILISILLFANVKGQLLQAGDAVVTFNDQVMSLAGQTPGKLVLGILKTNNTSGLGGVGAVANVALGTTGWNSYFKKNTAWTSDNLGLIFGVTIDNQKNIFVTASGFFGPQPTGKSTGAIYKIDGITGSVTLFKDLNPGGVVSDLALGNIKYFNGYLYVSNLKDGKIYCIDKTSANITDTHIPTGWLTNDKPCGLAIRNVGGMPRLFFSRNGFNATTTSIYSISLGAGGTFGTDQQLEIATASPTNNDAPITDIAFSKDGKQILLAQKTNKHQNTMIGINSWNRPSVILGVYAHYSTIIKYKFNGLPAPNAWTNTNANFGIGQYASTTNNKHNSSGGVDFSDFEILKNNTVYCDTSIYATADIIYISTVGWGYCYGVSGFNNKPNDGFNTGINFDLNNSSTEITATKSSYGDIEIVDTTYQCPTTYQDCKCGEWGMVELTLGGYQQFWCKDNITFDANQGDIVDVQPQFTCMSITNEPNCTPIFSYDIYFANGTSLLNQSNLKQIKLTECGLTRIVMKATCGGVVCPNTCEFQVNVSCCKCQQTLSPFLSSGSSDGVVGPTISALKCGETYTNKLDCFKPYSIYVTSPCGPNCQPDEVITTINQPSGPVLLGNTFIANQVGTYTVTIKVKCKGVWCAPCIIKFVQTKKCEPPCNNCTVNGQPKIFATFEYASSTATTSVYPGTSVLNAKFNLSGGTDTYTQVRANIVDFNISSDNKACLQCYNKANQWGSIINGSLPGFSSTVTSYGTVSTTSDYNNPREAVFDAPTATTIPSTGTGVASMNLKINLPGYNPISCCCIKVVLFVKLTFRNNKCEECTKIVKIIANICPGKDGVPEITIPNPTDIDTGHPQYKMHSPNTADDQVMQKALETNNKAKQ